MNDLKNNNKPTCSCGCRYKKCAKCYWFDNCPLNDMDEEEIEEMKEEGVVDPDDFANFDNVKGYFHDYCRYYTPFDDDELAIVEYERDLRERARIYQEIIDEQDS